MGGQNFQKCARRGYQWPSSPDPRSRSHTGDRTCEYNLFSIRWLTNPYCRASHVQPSPTFANVSSMRIHLMGWTGGNDILRNAVDGHGKISNKNAVPDQPLPHPSHFPSQPLYLHQLYISTTCRQNILLLEMMSLTFIRMSGRCKKINGERWSKKHRGMRGLRRERGEVGGKPDMGQRCWKFENRSGEVNKYVLSGLPILSPFVSPTSH